MEISGNLRRFVMAAMVGGRVCTMNNKKHTIDGWNVMDFDAVSLYPSAMHKVAFPVGVPKFFEGSTQFSDISENMSSYYIAHIILKKVNKNPNDLSIMAEFLKWNKSNGKVSNGLVKRRKLEAKLYFTK